MSRRLTEKMMLHNPMRQFERWFAAAKRSGNPEPTAMTLATANRLGQPHARQVLLKGIDKEEFIFFSHYKSPKAQDLSVQPFASLVFFWPKLGRQVRVSGKVHKVSSAQSDAYFASRPRMSQIGAHVSQQSQVVKNRQAIDRAVLKAQSRFAGKKIPRPKTWGGFRLTPTRIEFWQEGKFRLHDRIVFVRKRGVWQRHRLWP